MSVHPSKPNTRYKVGDWVELNPQYCYELRNVRFTARVISVRLMPGYPDRTIYDLTVPRQTYKGISGKEFEYDAARYTAFDCDVTRTELYE